MNAADAAAADAAAAAADGGAAPAARLRAARRADRRADPVERRAGGRAARTSCTSGSRRVYCLTGTYGGRDGARHDQCVVVSEAGGAGGGGAAAPGSRPTTTGARARAQAATATRARARARGCATRSRPPACRPPCATCARGERVFEFGAQLVDPRPAWTGLGGRAAARRRCARCRPSSARHQPGRAGRVVPRVGLWRRRRAAGGGGGGGAAGALGAARLEGWRRQQSPASALGAYERAQVPDRAARAQQRRARLCRDERAAARPRRVFPHDWFARRRQVCLPRRRHAEGMISARASRGVHARFTRATRPFGTRQTSGPFRSSLTSHGWSA